MRAVSHLHSIHPVAGSAWRPARSATDVAAHIVERLRHWMRHSTARQTAACLLLGHEKWTAMNGDWTCMRCGKLKRLECAAFAESPETLRSEMSALPRFGG